MVIINERWCIRQDPRNYVVCRRRPIKAESVGDGPAAPYQAVAYCHDLEGALEVIRKRYLKEKLATGEYAVSNILKM